jgi:hypothetical protein
MQPTSEFVYPDFGDEPRDLRAEAMALAARGLAELIGWVLQGKTCRARELRLLVVGRWTNNELRHATDAQLAAAVGSGAKQLANRLRTNFAAEFGLPRDPNNRSAEGRRHMAESYWQRHANGENKVAGPTQSDSTWNKPPLRYGASNRQDQVRRRSPV